MKRFTKPLIAASIAAAVAACGTDTQNSSELRTIDRACVAEYLPAAAGKDAEIRTRPSQDGYTVHVPHRSQPSEFRVSGEVPNVLDTDVYERVAQAILQEYSLNGNVSVERPRPLGDDAISNSFRDAQAAVRDMLTCGVEKRHEEVLYSQADPNSASTKPSDSHQFPEVIKPGEISGILANGFEQLYGAVRESPGSGWTFVSDRISRD